MSRARELADGRTTFVTDSISLGDDEKIKLGNSDDLQIFHSGLDSYINDTGTGDLNIKASNNLYLMSGASELYAKFTTDGAATLYHDNASKLATTSTGIDVTGTGTFTGNLGLGESNPLDMLSISSSAGNAAIRLKRTDTAIVNDDIYGVINFAGDDSDSNASGIRGFIRGRAAGTGGGMKMEFHTAGGGAALVSDPRMTLDADGQLGIGSASIEYPLQVSGSNVSSGGGLATLGIFDDGTAYNGTNPGGGISFRGKYNSSGNITNFATVQGIKENTTNNDYASALRFTTRSNGGNLTERLRIDSAGLISAGPFGGAGNAIIAGSSSPSYTNQPGTNLLLKSGDGSGTGSSYMTFSTSTGGASGTTVRTAAEAMRIQSDKIVVVTSGAAPIEPTIKHSGSTGYLAKLRITNRSGQAANKGGLLELGGVSDDGVSRSDIFGSIAGLKSTSGGSNREGYLQFSTSNGSSLAEAMRIDGSGNVGIGTTSPKRHLHINGGNETTKIQITNQTTGSGTDGDGFQIGIATDGTANIEQRENNDLAFYTNNTLRQKIDSAGHVMIGTTVEGETGAHNLTVADSGNAGITIRAGATSSSAIYMSDATSGAGEYGSYIAYAHDTGRLNIATASSPRMTIDGSGNVGIGTSSPSNFGTNSQGLSINGTGNYQNLVLMKSGATQFYLYTNGTSGTFLGTAVNQPLMFITNDAEKMRIDGSGNVGIGTTSIDGTLHLDAGTSSDLIIEKDATGSAAVRFHNAGSQTSYISLDADENMTHYGGSGVDQIFYAGAAERMRIDGSGNVHVRCTDTPSASVSGFLFTSDQLYTSAGNTTNTNTQVRFYNGNGLVGSISTAGSGTAYATSSDYRLKENVTYTWDATTRLKQLKPARFNWIADSDNTIQDGFLAHEVSSIVPEAVFGTKDAEIQENGDGYQSLDYSKLVPLLVKTILELEARITTLEG